MRVVFWKNATAFFSVVNASRVAPSLVHERRVGSGEHDDRVDIDVFKVAAAGLAARDDAFDDAGVSTKLGERRGEGLSPLGIPFGPVDIDEFRAYPSRRRGTRRAAR